MPLINTWHQSWTFRPSTSISTSSAIISPHAPAFASFTLTLALLLNPLSRENLGIEFDERIKIVLLGKLLKVLPDFWSISIEARPVWIRFERVGVYMSRNIASATWVSILKPSSSDTGISASIVSAFAVSLSLERRTSRNRRVRNSSISSSSYTPLRDPQPQRPHKSPACTVALSAIVALPCIQVR